MKTGKAKKILSIGVLLVAVAGVFALRQNRQAASASPSDTEAVAPPADLLLATVGAAEIRLADLDAFLDLLPPDARAQVGDDKDLVIDSLVERELLLQEARRLDLAGTAEYEEALARDPARPDREAQALIEALLRRKTAELPAPTEQDLRAFFDEHRAELPATAGFADVRDNLEAFLARQREQEWFEQFGAELRARMPVVINEENLERLRPASAADDVAPPGTALGIPRLVSLGANACVPCKMMEPIREELRLEYAGRMQVDFIDVWKNRRAGQTYRIRSIPTLVFCAPDGRELARREGYTPKEAILEQWARVGFPF